MYAGAGIQPRRGVSCNIQARYRAVVVIQNPCIDIARELGDPAILVRALVARGFVVGFDENAFFDPRPKFARQFALKLVF